MGLYVLELRDIDRSQVALVGGKGALLGELSRIEGIRVPPGFCVTTQAFRRVLADVPAIQARLDQLEGLGPDDQDGIRVLSADVRRTLESIEIPEEIVAAIRPLLDLLGEETAFAIRSSATAEDLPTASFAGQQDTYLNVVGPESVLQQISRCWASLFTERAVTYRLRNGFDQRRVGMAVVVQQMVFSEAAGTLFTADPVTGNRKLVSVEAGFGLGEGQVAGLVNTDAYTVRDRTIVDKLVATKTMAIQAAPAGGTEERPIDEERQATPALTGAQILRLAQLGRQIEAHFGYPQDIEWCLTGDEFQIVQSRPITTLFPIPATDDGQNHVYISVGHQQMMTDAMKPLGLSFWQLTTPRPMAEAGGRLFVDVTRELASPVTRAGLLSVLGRSDPLIADALQTILGRDGFIPEPLDEDHPAPVPGASPVAALEPDPAIVVDLIAQAEASIAAASRAIATKSGSALLDFIEADMQELRRILFDPGSHRVFMTAMDASWWLNERLEARFGEKNAADTLTQSVPHNVTSEMGLALLDVADVIRPHRDVVAFLRNVEDPDFLDGLPALVGGREARDAICAWLAKYGARCVGEIDITRPRWSERPDTLVPLLLANVENFERGEAQKRFERGRQEARQKEQELLAGLRALPDGASKAAETKQMIDRLRTFIGYREYPKYGMVKRYFVYKQALLEEARRLVHAGVLRTPEDIFYLTLQELHDVVRTSEADDELIDQRRAAFISYAALTPPRVLTSDGEGLSGAYRREDLPAGALAGLPVSAGVVEGRARVILDMADAELERGDILVTAYTDPSWTPLFVGIGGLVTEVGGAMTHGAVIAREYGLPAVVAVDDATRLITDRQRIRVDGTNGYVELLG